IGFRDSGRTISARMKSMIVPTVTEPERTGDISTALRLTTPPPKCVEIPKWRGAGDCRGSKSERVGSCCVPEYADGAEVGEGFYAFGAEGCEPGRHEDVALAAVAGGEVEVLRAGRDPVGAGHEF